ncbi:MAG TPA: leucyl/phenylalanyl-tRNA--protein transferase [Pyrinomonadaceae bacterium]|nr:leucyl/phenylalanyl-tRNA--protein transferase [Pyrinomonadaceae bacterium]
MLFPDPRLADENGIVAVGGRLNTHTLLAAYRQGIFPWPVEGYPMLWFCPAERAVLEFAELHVPRSLARARRLTSLRFTLDRAFASVIRFCAAVERPEQDGTWITDEVVEAFCEFHRRGHAHSVEAWEGDELVGGIYGVDAGGAFCGESMFYLRPNASKLALLHLVEHLRSRGLDWLDIQVMTPHMHALGAKHLPRETFLRKLAATRARGLKLF